METTQQAYHSSEAYHLVMKLINRLSWPERERLKHEIDLNGPLLTRHESSNLVHDHLTKRERQVLTLIANGFTRKEVARALQISHNTASCHVSHIYDKLQISTIAEATHEAMRMGFLQK